MTALNRDNELSQQTQHDARWAAVVARDSGADGTFVYSVRTTGVYCRPSCAARLAKPENVCFHRSCAEAEQAGFRPCKRCKPNEPSQSRRDAEKIAAVCRAIEKAEALPSLTEMARQAGLSMYHFHRLFKAVTGLTPKAYVHAHREKLLRHELGRGGSVTAAIYDAGYNSPGRFYEKSNQALGMTPSRFRAGGTDTRIRFAVGECSLGSILVAASDKGVCAILMGDDPQALTQELQDDFARAELIGGDEAFEQTVAQVIGLIEAPQLGLELPLDVRGTVFQQRVWRALQKIPAGKTASYTDIAKQLGASRAVRAVAQACAANTLAVAIPCHRVVRNDGSLSGYRWGVERKRALLERESSGRDNCECDQ